MADGRHFKNRYIILSQQSLDWFLLNLPWWCMLVPRAWRKVQIFNFRQSYTAMLWHCWLGGRKGTRPVKNWVVGCWHGYLSGELQLYKAQLMPLPLTVSCFSKIQIGFTFLVPAHPLSPGKRAIKRVCVCVCYTADRRYLANRKTV